MRSAWVSSWRCLLLLAFSLLLASAADETRPDPARAAKPAEAKPDNPGAPGAPEKPAEPPPPPAPSPAAVADALASSNLLAPEQRPPPAAPKKDHRFQIDTARQL